MTRSRNNPSMKRQGRLAGDALARLMLGVVSALLLLAVPLCTAQAQDTDCATMTMMPMEGSGHHQPLDQGAPVSKLDCTLGCRLLPQMGPQVTAPVRVTYEIHFEEALRRLDGIVIDPAVPPPRWTV
ncbi:MAG: hypothetical protein KA105_00260 [Caulobacter sp.]|nr:hypothetical protein [Caulobacter sp.]